MPGTPGSKIWERTGFVAPDTLVEELVPFMDAGPADPAASKLAQQVRARAAPVRRHVRAAGGTWWRGAAGGTVRRPRLRRTNLLWRMRVTRPPWRQPILITANPRRC